jgi:hypothetical protein
MVISSISALINNNGEQAISVISGRIIESENQRRRMKNRQRNENEISANESVESMKAAYRNISDKHHSVMRK